MAALDTLLLSLTMLSAGSLGGEGVQADAPTRYVDTKLTGQWDNYDRSMVRSQREPLSESKISPNGEWTFSHLSVGYGRRFPDAAFTHKFRVFSINAGDQVKLGDPAARTLLRLWDINVSRVNLDHRAEILGGCIDVYLSHEGSAGGEQGLAADSDQVFTDDPFTTTSNGKPQRVNVIYQYQVDQEVAPLERLRELAHEYGHATLPYGRGFSKPESDSSGHLGERLYIHWLKTKLAEGKITKDDIMGATAANLADYEAKNYLPLVKDAAFQKPDPAKLGKKDEAAFYSWIGLVLWAEACLPKRPFSRSLIMGASKDPDPSGLPSGMVEGVAEFPTVEVNLPAWTQGKSVWLPLGKGKITGGKVSLRVPTGWALVVPTGSKLTITNPPMEQQAR